MITKGNNCLAPKGHVNEMEVSHFISTASHMGFPHVSKSGSLEYALSRDMETSTSRKSRFFVTISLTFNYVPTYDSSLVDPPG